MKLNEMKISSPPATTTPPLLLSQISPISNSIQIYFVSFERNNLIGSMYFRVLFAEFGDLDSTSNGMEEFGKINLFMYTWDGVFHDDDDDDDDV